MCRPRRPSSDTAKPGTCGCHFPHEMAPDTWIHQRRCRSVDSSGRRQAGPGARQMNPMCFGRGANA